MTSITSTTGSAALTILTNLSQFKTEGGLQRSSSVPALAPVAAGVSGAGAAEKSVSSAIFNAVANIADQNDPLVQAAVKYIDDNYTNYDKTFAYVLATSKDNPEVVEHFQRMKETGEQMKQLVLSDPAGFKQQLSAIMKSRPDLSQDGALSIFTLNLTEGLSAKGVPNAATVQSAASNTAEATMSLVNEIQSQMRFYHMSLAAQEDADSNMQKLNDLSASSSSLKTMAEVDPEKAAAFDEADRALAARLSEAATLSGAQTGFVTGIADRIKDLTDQLSKVATIEGDILVKQADGNFDLGSFYVRDKSGTVSFSADANGQVTYTSLRRSESYYGRLQ